MVECAAGLPGKPVKGSEKQAPVGRVLLAGMYRSPEESLTRLGAPCWGSIKLGSFCLGFILRSPPPYLGNLPNLAQYKTSQAGIQIMLGNRPVTFQLANRMATAHTTNTATTLERLTVNSCKPLAETLDR